MFKVGDKVYTSSVKHITKRRVISVDKDKVFDINIDDILGDKIPLRHYNLSGEYPNVSEQIIFKSIDELKKKKNISSYEYIDKSKLKE